MTHVDAPHCIRCAACATVAPAHFAVARGPAKLTRAPETAAERRRCTQAAALCPTEAIVDAPPLEPGELRLADDDADEIFPSAISTSEGVRWSIESLPWSTFDAARASPALIAVVREMAYSEQTTFSATGRFMQAFGADIDFSQWISVWFYEETRHPLVLLRWLALAGHAPEPDFAQRGRVSAPFMKSAMGTLVTNVISELFAAEAYRGLSASAPEPLLVRITQAIAADEARHAAGFFRYARRLLDTSAQPDRERLDALKVLHFWLEESASVSHPVNEAMHKLGELMPAGGALAPFVAPRARVTRAVGALLGLDLREPSDVEAALREHTQRVHAAR